MASVSLLNLSVMGAGLAGGDYFVVGDVSDTTQSASGSDVRILATDFFGTIPVPIAVTSASAVAFAVGLAGATNPAFVVDASTATQAAGLKVTGAVAAGTVTMVVISSGAAASLTINAKGTGTIGIGSVSTGAVTITPATTITGALTVSAGIVVAAAQAITGTVANSTISGFLSVAATTFTGNLTGNVTGNVSGTAPAGSLTGTTLTATVVTSSLTTVGALNAGSITSGFGAINIGANTLTAGAISGTTGNFTSFVQTTLASGNTTAFYLTQTGVAQWILQNVATTGLFTITENGVGNWFTIAKTTGAATFSSTLAVTGATTIGTTAASASLKLGSAAPSANWGATFTIGNSNTVKNWQISTNTISGGGALDFTPSTATGGFTFTTPTVTLTPALVEVKTAFAVTGNVGIGGAATATSKLNVTGIPVAAAGLAAGDVWSNLGILTIV